MELSLKFNPYLLSKDLLFKIASIIDNSYNNGMYLDNAFNYKIGKGKYFYLSSSRCDEAYPIKIHFDDKNNLITKIERLSTEENEGFIEIMEPTYQTIKELIEAYDTH
jgi:hypothetical protein